MSYQSTRIITRRVQDLGGFMDSVKSAVSSLKEGGGKVLDVYNQGKRAEGAAAVPQTVINQGGGISPTTALIGAGAVVALVLVLRRK